ncbi:MAG: hypothetical protein RJB39_30 [Candidatus Parcubacteria bacterium]|jgi:ribokinase
MIINTMNKINFLAIGDTVIDAFIKLTTASVHEDPHGENKTLCMPFAEKVPFESVTEIPAVGNSANAAVSAARLGLSSALLTCLGADENGKKCLDQFAAEKVDVSEVNSIPGKITNYHYVLWYQNDRTILIKHELFEYHVPIIVPEYIYLSSLGENSLPFHHDMAAYLQAHPEVKLVFQPGTFQIKFGTDELAEIYKRTHILFCNKEEAIRILKLDDKADHDIKHLLLGLRNLGVQLPVITDGPFGAYTYDTDIRVVDSATFDELTPVVHMPIYPDIKPPLERTGAGDAFASTFTSALALGRTITEALMWGSINSMSVCQDIGAQRGLLTEEKIEAYIKVAPEGWGPVTL